MIWRREENRGHELRGKTIGIIGCGHTGEQVARKLSCWDTKILVYDKYRKEFPSEMNYIEIVDIEDILASADIITLHLPLTHETRYMVDKRFLQKCKRKPLIVNTSRGEVINTSSLIQALKEEKIFGACIDVFENEKVNTYTKEEIQMYETLFSFKNVIVSPHIAGWTKESLEAIAQVLLDKIKATIC
jgi:D-3-phosphoglycerate dehydrogenase